MKESKEEEATDVETKDADEATGGDIDVDAANAHPLLGLGRDTDCDPADGGDDTDDDLPDLEEAGGAEDWGG